LQLIDLGYPKFKRQRPPTTTTSPRPVTITSTFQMAPKSAAKGNYHRPSNPTRHTVVLGEWMGLRNFWPIKLGMKKELAIMEFCV
jgi:hypothetical protein